MFVDDCFNYLLDIQKESSKSLTRKPIASSSSAMAPFQNTVKLWLSPYPWSYAPLTWESRPLHGGCWKEGPSQETRTLGCMEVEGKTTAYTWSILLENQFYSKYRGGNGISIETQLQVNYGVEWNICMDFKGEINSEIITIQIYWLVCIILWETTYS